MKRTFEIYVKIRTPTGYTNIGSFSLGDDREFAYSTFDSLKAQTSETIDPVISLCLAVKDGGSAPRELNSIGCILDDFAKNSKIIVRDLFKFYSLEQ